MNRQKKELLKQIRELEISVEIDMELGFGIAPPGAHDKTFCEIYKLQEKLAHLRHYKTVEEMYYDERGQATVDEILRQAKPARNQKPGRSHNNSRGMGR